MSFESMTSIGNSGIFERAIADSSIPICEPTFDEDTPNCRVYIDSANFQFTITKHVGLWYPTFGYSYSDNALDKDTFTLNNVIYTDTLRRWESDSGTFIANNTPIHNVLDYARKNSSSPPYFYPNCETMEIEVNTVDAITQKVGASGKWVIENTFQYDLVDFTLYFILDNGTIQYISGHTFCMDETQFNILLPYQGQVYMNNLRYNIPSGVLSGFVGQYIYEPWGELNVIAL